MHNQNEHDKLLLEKANLALPLFFEKSIFMASFDGFIVFGKTNQKSFQTNEYFQIYYENFSTLAKECISIIAFFSKGCETKPDLIRQINQNVSIKYKFSDLCFEFMLLKDEFTYNLTFDIFQFSQFIQSFKVLLLSSLILTYEQSLFLHYVLKKDLDFDNINKKPHLIISLSLAFITELNLKLDVNFYLIEIFEYHYDLLKYIKNFSSLIEKIKC